MPLPTFAPSDDERVIAGVCAGIAQALAVDVTLVRLVFAVLALAGGAGIVLYLALWVYGRSSRAWWAAVLVLISGSLLLHAVGLSDQAVAGIALVAAGFAIVWRQGGNFRPDEPLSYGGLPLAGGGAGLLLGGRRREDDAPRAGSDRGSAAADRGPVALAPRARPRRRACRADSQRGALGGRGARARLGAADACSHPAPRAGAAAGRSARAPAR